MSDYALIAGRYQIETLIGRGGMGDVYRGIDTQTGQPVAIKLLHQSIVESNPDLVDRFSREGEALGQLNHPNIVKLLDAFEEGNKHYLVMEFVGGGSLRDLLDDQGRLPLEAVLNIALDLADALTRAHRLNIIHRDIKPDNVLLAEDSTPRLTDFGVAHLADRTRLTQTGSVIGTYAYLSPEACNGLDLDERTDIWSFGVMLYEMLAGRVPFQESSTAAVVTAILTKPAPDLLRLRPSIPEALVMLIYRMLEKDRERRISSVRLIGAELEAIIRGLDTPLRQIVLAQSHTQEESRFATPSDHGGEVPAMVRASPDQTHGLSLYPSPAGAPSGSVPGPGGMVSTPGGGIYTTGTMPAVSASKWPWISLTIIVTVLACALVAVVAIFFGPELDKEQADHDTPAATALNVPAGSDEPGSGTPQAALAVEPVEAGEYMVLVANLENLAGVVKPGGANEITRFITSDLKETLERTVAFSNLRVRSYSPVITSEEEAIRVAEQVGATVVVWGSYTPDMIEVTVQVGSLAAFPYLKFDREILDRTANVRVHIANVRAESVAPQVLGVISLLQTADGNGFESMRVSAIQDALSVTPAEIVGSSVASYVHRCLYTLDPAQAVQELQTALGLDPANPLLYVTSSILEQQQGLLDAARQDALTAQRIGPPEWAMPVLLLANLAQDATVFDLFTQVIQQRPDDWFPLFYRGAIYYQMAHELPGALDLARADLAAAMALDPEASFPYVYAALLAMHEGRLDDAQQAIRTIVTEFPDPGYMTRLLRATFQGTVVNPYEVILSAFTNQTLGRYEAVVDDTRRGLQVYTGMEDAYFLQGMAYCAQGDYAAAEQSFTAEMEIDASFALNTLMRADARLHLDDQAAAASDFDLIAGGSQADVFAPYVEAVKAGSLGCATFFTPDLTPQAAETSTPTPEAGDAKTLKPGEHLVLVAQIEPLDDVNERDVARFVAENLSRTFEEDIPNSGIRVRRYPSIITSSSEARDIAEANQATVIVWGNYTPSQIELEVQVGTTAGFPSIPFAREMVEQSANVRVTLADERRQSAALPVIDLLNILSAADGSEYDLLITLMYASTLSTPGGIVKDNSVAAHLHRALMTYRADTENAIEELTDALQVDGSNPLIYAYRSLANLRAGESTSAVADLETARRLGPANWTLPLYLLAQDVTADQADPLQVIIQNFSQIIDLRPDDWFAYFMRGIIYYYGAADFAAAQSDLQHAIDLGSRANLPYIPLMMMALREGRMAEAQSLMGAMLTQYPDPELTNRAMQALYGRSAEHDFTGTLFSAATNLALGQYDRVVEDVQVVEDFLTANPDALDLSLGARDLGDLFTLQGLAYCNLQNYSGARHALDNAIMASEDFELLYLLRGQMRQALDDNTGAQQDFARARVHVLGPEFTRWVETSISGKWTCQTMLEYQMPE